MLSSLRCKVVAGCTRAASRWKRVTLVQGVVGIVLVLPSLAAAAQSPPVKTSLPAVSDSAVSGAILTGSLGTWSTNGQLRTVEQWDTGLTLRNAVMASNVGAASAVSSQSSVELAGSCRPVSTAIPGIGVNRVGASWGSASANKRYGYVVVGRSMAAAAARLPGKSLVYQSGTSVNVNFNTGVPYSVASANDWLLKGPSGNYLRNLSFPDNYIGDVGNSAYQAAWASRVGDYLISVGVDGVFLDDVIADIKAMTNVYPTKYPDQVSWENAMVAFVATVGSALEQRGLYALVNAHKWIADDGSSDNGVLEAQWWRRLAPHVSGLHAEYWLQDPTNVARLRALGPEWWNNWDGWQRLVAVTQKAGADFFGLIYGVATDTRVVRYGKASFLLDWHGGGGAVMFVPTDRSDPWNSEWTTDIGRALAAKTSPSPGVWLRRFERGTVVVNATQSTVTLSVNGIARTIGPIDALILTGVGSSSVGARYPRRVPKATCTPTGRHTGSQGALSKAPK